jgi:hypothetical protein
MHPRGNAAEFTPKAFIFALLLLFLTIVFTNLTELCCSFCSLITY